MRSKIADDAVDSEHKPWGLDTEIGLWVTTAKIAMTLLLGYDCRRRVDSEHLVDGAIDTAHIADGQVTTAKIASDAITEAKVADSAIQPEHLNGMNGSIWQRAGNTSVVYLYCSN